MLFSLQLECRLPAQRLCLVSGDAMGVFRVWQFLDSWGVINYQAGAGTANDANGVPVNVQPAGRQTSLQCEHPMML